MISEKDASSLQSDIRKYTAYRAFPADGAYSMPVALSRLGIVTVHAFLTLLMLRTLHGLQDASAQGLSTGR
ncbi:hypothetical protein ACE4RV_06210 [Acetobacter persici]|uniref:hypothetical protein n=1 Tax=Acetobacter persici TaxID=1076596 RepID=UPI0036DC8EE0